ncbi:UDP-glucose dehydrogenase family protein [Acidobacteriota bacterium]
MQIGIIGTGYVGLVTAVGLAELGNRVTGTDIASDKIEKASQGVAHIYEPGLEDLLKKNLKKGNLNFEYDLDKTIQSSDVLFICVSTPQREDGSADMTYVESVSRRIAVNLNKYKLVVEKSTVPVKTSTWVKRTIELYKKGDIEFDVASNPEFLREGSAVEDFMQPDRIVVGVESERARDMMIEIYKAFADRILVTNIDTAELIKHASNSFLAMKISYTNLMADLCERTQADIESVAKGMGLDERIGNRFLKAGVGYGGSCFPKDVRALIKIGEDLGVNMDLLRDVDKINMERVGSILEKLKKALWILKDKKIAVLGLAFKPETDDIRNAPSIPIIQALLEEGAQVTLYDPQAVENMKGVIEENHPGVEYAASAQEALKGANAALLVTEWDEFKTMDLKRARKLMDNPILIDGRNVFNPDEARELGFDYYSVGRK